MKLTRPVTATILVALVVLVILAGIWTGLLLTFDKRTNLFSPRFTADGRHILYVERSARGIAIGPGIESFTPPAYLHVFSDAYSLKEMDLDGLEVQTHFTWTIPREQFWIPSYRNHLFGYPRIKLDLKGDVLQLHCSISEINNPSSIQHDKKFWYNLKESTSIDKTAFDAVDIVRPWHKNRLSGPWEVMEYQAGTIFLERFNHGVSHELRFLRGTHRESVTEVMLSNDLPHIRQRPQLEKLESKREVRQQLVENYTSTGMSVHAAEMKAIDALEDMGLSPKSKRIVARRIDHPLDSSPVFTISDMEFKMGLYQDIDQAITLPGKEIRHWGNYIKHRNYETSVELNAHLKTSRKFQVKTSQGVFEMEILY